MRTLLVLLPACLISGVLLQGQTSPRTKTIPAEAVSPAKRLLTDYKETGSPSARVTVEVYADYECPTCGQMFREFMPRFTADYIRTGKVRFIHHDFPIPAHQHEQLAARYANAAGELGFYDVVVNQIYQTQNTWSQYGGNTGNIDGEVAKVLPPGALLKVREMVRNDQHLDDTVKQDVAMANGLDHVTGTPTIIVVTNGKREDIGNVMALPYTVFRKYLDGKLAAQ